MKLSAIISAVCFLLVLNAAHVESRGVFRWYKMLLAFGDSFADTGNLPKPGPADGETEISRQWYFPYGLLRETWGLRPTGRFSNGMVQSDLVAKMIGRTQAPPPYRVMRNRCFDPPGVNFAAGGAGVYPVPHKVPTLGKQVDQFERMVEEGSVPKWRLRDSVALVAISGNDYARVANMSSMTDIIAFIGNVTSEIAKEVQRLQNLGVSKILVNNLHPLGCTPWQSRPNNHTGCDGRGNLGASVHNSNLKQKLGSNDKDIFLVDLHTAFSNIVNPTPGSDQHEMSNQFKHKLTPCCESFDPNGYCGQHTDNSTLLYSICTKDERHFYWDDVHPTEEGWLAVMKQLEDPIRKFLGLI